MNQIDVIRAELEQAYKDRFQPHSVELRIDAVLAALAELERAAAEPAVFRYEFLSHSGWHASYIETRPHDAPYVRNITPLYAAPPAPVAEIREPTPEECERICTEYERLLMREGTCGGRDAFDAVRAVMWPKEGL